MIEKYGKYFYRYLYKNLYFFQICVCFVSQKALHFKILLKVALKYYVKIS